MQAVNELKSAAYALEPTHPVERRMLKEALNGDWASGLHRQKQEELVRIHKAKQKILEAIALLEGTERAIHDSQHQKVAFWEKVAPGELRPAAATLICQYFGLTKLFQKEGLWYAFALDSPVPRRVGQHLWLELCKTKSTEWIKAKLQEIESKGVALPEQADDTLYNRLTA